MSDLEKPTDHAELLAKLDNRQMWYKEPNSFGGWDNASYPDPECVEAADAIRSLIRERDEERALRMKLSDDYAFGKYADSDEKVEMKRRAEAAEARAAELEKALADIVAFTEFEPEAQRIDVWHLYLKRARAALARKGKG